MGTESKRNALLVYRLTFGNFLAKKDKQPAMLQLEHGSGKKVSDGTKEYFVVLCGVKINRQIYQPTEIEAELDISQTITDTSGKTTGSAPKFSDVRDFLLQREVSLDILEMDRTPQALVCKEIHSIATNCYVYELTPQLKKEGSTTKMYVKLSIFSMDKLMTLNKYSKAYVARKLGSEILQPESLQFGTISDGVPLIETDVDSQRHLTYAVGDKRGEFIQPYLVQYNESFYDFLVRTSNRCGEFLYFEDGRLVLGLPDSGEAVEIDDFASVTVPERSADPLEISGYARDSVKDGIGAVKGSNDAKGGDGLDLNISAIAREATGFPKDAFPQYTSSNAEMAQDDYIFPLYMSMFTNRKRELNYDGTPAQIALGRSLQFCKTLLANKLNNGAGAFVPIVLDSLLGEAIPTMLADLRVFTWNSGQAERYLGVLKDKIDQIDEQKGVQFGTANADGWTTLNYYRDILQHEEAQQRKIICIDMGTSFIPVKLGQKIKIKELDDVYVVIQIQQLSEEAWNLDYDRYGEEADDKYAGSRSQKIYAIPAYGDNKDQFIPPVHPVPIIRKAGPQTAFVTDNEDPKFQGRVRVAFPWQSLGGAQRNELAEVTQSLVLVENTLNELKEKEKKTLSQSTRLSAFVEELKGYVKATKEEREKLLAKKQTRLDGLEEDKSDQRKQLREEIADLEAAAQEHDQKQGNEDYKNLEKDNSVICRYHTAYKEANRHYLAAKADIVRVEKDKEKKKGKCQKLVEYITKEVNDMATPWVRVVTPMATPGGGTFFRPRVGDEVLVNFENGNVERPYVMGSVFSKNNLTPDEKMYRQRGVELQGKDVSIAMMSPNGHHITFTDPVGGTNFLTNLVSPGLGLWGTIVGASFTNLLPQAKDLTGGIHIGDRYGLYEIDMKSHKRSIEINSPFGTVSINAFSGITISAPNGDVTIRGKNINLEAGNKINIKSGLNIEDPGFGDPDGGGYQFGKAMTDIFAEYLPEGITDYFFSSVVDLSYIRHVMEVIVRPVDGTLKLKSKRYLMLEAGKGNATIRRDRYATKTAEQKESQEEFFKAMLACVKHINEKVDGFYDTYEALWIDGHKKQVEYKQTSRYFLKDPRKPNLAEVASKLREWKDDSISIDTFDGYFDEKLEFYNGKWIGKKPIGKYVYVEDEAKAYCEAAFKMYYHVASFLKQISDTDGLELGEFDWVGTCVYQAITELSNKLDWLNSWNRLFGDGDEGMLFYSPDPVPADDKFAMAHKKIFKRKLLLYFISKVGEAPQNANNKYFRCGLRIDEILAKEWIRQEFYWNRTVFFLDRSKKMNFTNYGRKLWDSTLGLIGKTFKSTLIPEDRSIWNDKVEGQILFSDQEDKTLNFQGEGLHEESSSNIGTMDHLKKELMAIK